MTTLAPPVSTPEPDDLRTPVADLFGAVYEAVVGAHGELAVLTRDYLQELLRLRVAKTDAEWLTLMRGVHVLNLRLATDELLAHPERRADIRAAAERFARKTQRGFEQPLILGAPLPDPE